MKKIILLLILSFTFTSALLFADYYDCLNAEVVSFGITGPDHYYPNCLIVTLNGPTTGIKTAVLPLDDTSENTRLVKYMMMVLSLAKTNSRTVDVQWNNGYAIYSPVAMANIQINKLHYLVVN